MFMETMDNLPRLHYGGDIVMLSDVMMKVYDGVIHAVFNKKFSKFALFEGKCGKSLCPYQFYKYDHINDHDIGILLQLRKWSVGHQIATDSTGFKSLKDIREGDHFNLICKILLLRKVKEDEWMLLVWDGTDTPPCFINAKLEDEMEHPLPLQAVPVCLPRDVIRGLPPLGTVLRVTLDCGNEKPSMNMLQTNRWVKFDNLRCQIEASLWHASLVKSTRFCYLHGDDDIVLQRTREYNERWLSNQWMPLSSLPCPTHLTATNPHDDHFVTLMCVLAHTEVLGTYRCVVRVVEIIPWRVEDYYSRKHDVYRVRLTLEDPTARIHAYLYDADAEKFFGVVHSPAVLTRKRNKLIGISGSDGDDKMKGTSRHPPWIMCCLKSYYTDESDMWGSRKFGIFDTRFEG